jgi:phenylalanyl-tRNA synthetase alpha subunit
MFDYPDEDGEDSSSSSVEDEEEVRVDEEEAIVLQKLSRDDPRRMQVTMEERRWALEIKNSIQLIAELDNLSDYMYAQLAIITRGNVKDAIRRVTGLQHYRQEYNILDTLQDGCQQLLKLFDLFPEQFLSFSFSESEGTYVLIHDATKFDTTALNTPEKVQSFMAAAYYLEATKCPDMASIRRGSIVFVEW